MPYVHLARGALREVPVGAALALDEDQRRHLHRVLRLQAGADLVVADGEGREAAATLGVNSVVVAGPVVAQPAPAPRVHLVQALAKGRKVDEVVRAATELGVDRVTVVGAERSILRVTGEKASRLRERWEAVARAAAEQARRPWLPLVAGPVPLGDWLAAAGRVHGVVGDPAASTSLRSAVASLPEALEEVVAVVGPEGGLTEDEVAALAAAGVRPASMGEFVLRTEHAGQALCAVLSFHLGRMG